MPVEDTFEEWAFGGEPEEKRFREQLSRLLETKLETVSQYFALSEVQRKKLHLAGLGDVKHLLDRVHESRQAFAGACADIRLLPLLQTRLRVVEDQISSGPFESGSMLLKTLRKMSNELELRPRENSPPG